LQVDENQHSNVNNANYQNSNAMQKQATDAALDRMQGEKDDNGFGDKITKLTDATVNHYTIPSIKQ
jgi:hypothetical protein